MSDETSHQETERNAKTKRKRKVPESTEPRRKSPRLSSKDEPSQATAANKPRATRQKITKTKSSGEETTTKTKKAVPAKKAPPKKTGRGRRKKMAEANESSDQETSEMSEFDWENVKSVHDFTVRDIKGNEVSLEKYKGFVLLIVNVASKCGLTSSNYAQLVKLDEQYREKGLRILAFPCNQFGHQEPGSAETICEFVKKKNANFDLFEKIEVNGKSAHPLYKYLKKQQPGTLGDFIKWNFTKFIVDKEGKPVERHPPTSSPESLIPNIEKYL